MAKGYTKQDVELHSDGFGRQAHPAVNVKVYHYPSVDGVVDRFGCSEETAERAIEYAMQMHTELFWEAAQGVAEDYLGAHVIVFAESRGWLVVHGLDEPANWDAIMLGKWHRFEAWARAETRYQSSQSQIEESIEANEWAHDQAAMENVIAEALA